VGTIASIEKYLNKITSQHKTKPKFMGWLSAILELFGDLMDVAGSMDDAFDLDKAVGAQLDIIGQWVGVSRLLNFEPAYAAPLLPDSYYRKAIKAKISLNRWDGTTEGIKEIWQNIFNDYALTVVDKQDMSVVMVINGLESLFETEFMSRGYLAPKPEGVRIHYIFMLSRKYNAELYIGSSRPAMRKMISIPDLEPQFDIPSQNVYLAGAIVCRHKVITLD